MLAAHLNLHRAPGRRCSARPRPVLLGLSGLAPALLCLPLLSSPAAAQGDDALTVRINDMSVVPGGRVAVVLRTYESRPIGQGQVCLRVSQRVFTGAESAVVVSAANDATRQLQPVDARTFVLQFSSASGSINEQDGPFAVLYFRARADLSPGSEFNVSIDMLNTLLIDALGQPITVDPREGRILVRTPGDPLPLAADGDIVKPGEIASLTMETSAPIALRGGSLGMRYDPALVVGSPIVTMKPVYGNASFVVDDSVPGLVLVTFESADASLGRIPGGLVQVDVWTLSTVPPGTRSPVTLDPALTSLVARDQEPIAVVLEPGALLFE